MKVLELSSHLAQAKYPELKEARPTRRAACRSREASRDSQKKMSEGGEEVHFF